MAVDANVTQEGRSRYAIVDALNRDWRDLVHRDRGTVSCWAQQHAELSGCSSLDDVLLVGQLNPDATLSALLTEVSNGDQLAGRTVLQSMLGRLLRMAQRDSRAGVDDYVAAFWCVMQTYPLHARPERIAANLSMDAFKMLHKERRWLGQGSVTTWPPDAFLDETLHRTAARTQLNHAEADREKVTASGVLAAGHRLRLIDEPTRRLLHSVYIDGLTGSEAARRHRTTPGSVRARSSKAVKRLAAHGSQLVEAA
jgi:DNA-directed RNA polymerase specialized sigma24 family protein